MTRDQLEYVIGQYLDGTLPAEEVGAVERMLREEGAAREVLASLRRLDALLKGPAVPEVDFDTLAGRISAALPGEVPAPAVSEAGQVIGEDLERDIQAYVDGTLPAGRAAEVAARIDADAELARLAEEYRGLAELTAHAWELPALDWDALARRISAEVTAHARAELLTEEAEYRLTRYLDGDATEEEARAVEARLATDPAARLALAEHRRLVAALRSEPVPPVDYDALAAEISQAVAEEARASRMRIGTWVKRAAAVAVAACVIVGATIAYRLSTSPTTTGTPGGGGPIVKGPAAPVSPVAPARTEGLALVEVAGPEKATGTAVVEVTVGPSEFARRRSDRYSPGVVAAGPTRVRIAGVAPVAYGGEVEEFGWY